MAFACLNCFVHEIFLDWQFMLCLLIILISCSFSQLFLEIHNLSTLLCCRSNIEGTSNDSILKPEHKIFLSHSGAQKEFVWHLCEALQQRGHIPFFDKLQSSLPKGEQFSELILKAAHQCEMAVVVVSEEYFMSKWPMIELHAFVQATKRKSNIKLKILPLFYRLSVSEFLDEKRQRRWFQKWESWAKDDPKERIKVGEWKEALNLLKSYNGILYNQELQDILSYQNNIVSNICGSIVPDIKWNDSHIQGKSNILKVRNIYNVLLHCF
jgi:hypothetical protein